MAKTQDKKAGARAPQNIEARGGAFPAIVAVGLALALLGVGLGFAYITAVQTPRQENTLIGNVTRAYAVREASDLHRFLSRLQARVAGAATSPLALQSIATRAETDIHLVEKAMLDYFPEAVSLRILPLGELGTTVFADGNQGLRNHIEVDLVRRAGEGEDTEPESFQFEGKWLTSMAQVVSHPRIRNRRAVIIVTIANTQLDRQLELLEPVGSAVLQQVYTDSAGNQRSQDIASAGSAGNRGEHYTHHAPLPDTRWRVAFTPGDPLLDSLTTDRTPLYAATGLGVTGAALGVLLTAALYRRRVQRETEQLISVAESRTRLSLGLPELASIGRQLRRATRQSLSRGAAAGAEADMEVEEVEGVDEAAPVAERVAADTTPAEPSSLLYQSSDIIDRVDSAPGEDVLELDLDEGFADAGAEEGFPDHIFRAYDIRGDAETELTDELVQRIGRAVGTLAIERGESQVILGSDGRLSSPRIRSQLLSGLLETGLDVIDIGLVPTPLLYFATQHLDCRSGVMVTGSHNPASDNGIKVVLDRETIAEGGIQDIRQRVIDGGGEPGYTRGRVRNENVVPAYIDEVAADIAIAVPLKIVIDAGNGATGELAPQLFTELGCDVVPLHCEIDGHFPNHPPDTSDERNLQTLCETVRAEGADFGVAFDGDGDRIAVVTGSGQIVRTDLLLMLFAQDVVSRNPGADVVFDVKCSRNLARLITRHGGRPVLWKTGHALMKQKIAETGALLGGEFSGHIFFGERWYGHDDGMYAAGRLAEILSTHDQSLDSALEDFPQTVNTPEILVPLAERRKFALMQRIVQEADFGEGKVNTLDGVRVDFGAGWGLLRASNTSAALTARFEADTEEDLEAIKQVFREQVARVEPALQLSF